MGLALHVPGIGPSHGNVFGTASRTLQGVFKGIQFAETLTNKLDNAQDGLDAATQLAAMFAGGTPVATVTNLVANVITQGVRRAVGGQVPAAMQSQLQRALSAALAPPGNAPPGQQASVLLNRIRTAVAGLTSANGQTAGQQNRLSGNVLDAANTAKEIPAPQTATASTTQALVTQALAQLRGTAQPAASGDILGRMLSRAVASQAQRTLQIVATNVPDSTATASSAPNAPAIPAPVSPTAIPSAEALFQRLGQQVIASLSAGAGDANGQNSSSSGFAFGDGNASSGQPAAPTQLQPTSDFAAVAAAVNSTTPNTAASIGNVQPVAPQAIDPQAVIDQIVNGIAVSTMGDTTNVRLKLSPEHLGEVSLQLSVTGGTIDASIVAQNSDVRDLLASNQHQLAHSLSEAGLSLGNFSVDVSGGNGDGRSTDPQLQQARRAAAPFALAAEDDEAVTETRLGPSILSRPNDPWLLNYFA